MYHTKEEFFQHIFCYHWMHSYRLNTEKKHIVLVTFDYIYVTLLIVNYIWVILTPFSNSLIWSLAFWPPIKSTDLLKKGNDTLLRNEAFKKLCINYRGSETNLFCHIFVLCKHPKHIIIPFSALATLDILQLQQLKTKDGGILTEYSKFSKISRNHCTDVENKKQGYSSELKLNLVLIFAIFHVYSAWKHDDNFPGCKDTMDTPTCLISRTVECSLQGNLRENGKDCYFVW